MKQSQELIDSMHLKVLSVKKELLKNSIVIVCLDESEFGQYDLSTLQQIAEQFNDIEPSGAYFLTTKRYNIRIYDRAELRNRDLIITCGQQEDMTEAEVTAHAEMLHQAIPEAKSISIVNTNMKITY